MKINQAKLSGFGAHHRTVWPSWLSPCNCKLPGPPLKRSDSDWVEKSVRYWVEKTSSRRERERERERTSSIRKGIFKINNKWPDFPSILRERVG